MAGEKKYHHVVMCLSGNDYNNKEKQKACWGFTVLVLELPPTITVENLIEMGSCVGTVVEVRLFLKDNKAHIKFSKVDEAIKFMELANRQPIPSDDGCKTYRPLMTPSSDYPCLKVQGLPNKISKDFLSDSVKRQAPSFELVSVREIFKDNANNMAVLQFASQRVADKMLSFARKQSLFVGGRPLTFEWEGTPVARVELPRGFKDKGKLHKAFDVIEGNHVLGVAILKDRAYVYFDFRYNLEKASDVIGDTVQIEQNDGTMEEFFYFLF